MSPLAIDLFCGLGGWTAGLLESGYRVIGFDLERHAYGTEKYPAQLVLQDVLTIHGSQFKSAALIVASPPCQEYSYMAMPWSRAKQIASALRCRGDFPEGYKGSRTITEVNALFNACFRIQREASEAAGHHIPMVIENVRGAQPWVGKARANYGSFYLWGDVPVLMPVPYKARKVPGFRFDGSGGSFQTASVEGTKRPGMDWKPPHDPRHRKGQAFQSGVPGLHHEAVKHGGDCFSDPSWPGKQGGTKQPGISGPRSNGKGDAWFQDGAAKHGSKSSARKAASARIAKIPARLSAYIARYYLPESAERVA